MKTFIVTIISFVILFSFGCVQKVNIAMEKDALLKILAADDKELLDGVIKEESGDSEESINIMDGNLERRTGTEANRRNKTLLERGKFVRIENLDGPIISVSPDGHMAWVAVKTKFVIAYTDSSGAEKEWEGTEARLEVYEKKNGKWHAVVCAQTH